MGRRLIRASTIAAAFVALISISTPAGATSTGTTSWTVFDYNPSGQALAPRVSDKRAPPSVSGNTASFNFLPNTFTALLTTSDSTMTGDLTGKTLTDTISVLGVTGHFQDQNGGPCTPDVQSTRLFFSSPGFEFTNFWWSNPVSVPLTAADAPVANLRMTIMGHLANPGEWSDWNGNGGFDSPAVTAGFFAAVSKVQTVGLSFGGGCFFENGVTTSDGSGTISSSFSES
jgi:hypothetical protein